jgi:RNA recognition motif-containing protein
MQQADRMKIVCLLPRKSIIALLIDVAADLKHRGYAFVTFSSAGDAQDAIDNMDMNELRGRILKVSIARPMKGVTPATGNRASKSYSLACDVLLNGPFISVWESEDWLKQYAKPLAGSGGEGEKLCDTNNSLTCLLGLRGPRNDSPEAPGQDDAEQTNDVAQDDQ